MRKKLFEILILLFGVFASAATIASLEYAVLTRYVELERESATRSYEIGIGNVMNQQMKTLRVYRQIIVELTNRLERAEKNKVK